MNLYSDTSWCKTRKAFYSSRTNLGILFSCDVYLLLTSKQAGTIQYTPQITMLMSVINGASPIGRTFRAFRRMQTRERDTLFWASLVETERIHHKRKATALHPQVICTVLTSNNIEDRTLFNVLTIQPLGVYLPPRRTRVRTELAVAGPPRH